MDSLPFEILAYMVHSFIVLFSLILLRFCRVIGDHVGVQFHVLQIG